MPLDVIRITGSTCFSAYQERMTPDMRAARIATDQFGLIGRCQAMAVGLSKSQITRRIETGRWQIIVPDVYRFTGAPSSWEQDCMAACLWGREGSALSHCAAARLWGFAGFRNAEVEISTTTQRRNPHVGFRVHRVRAELAHNIDWFKGIPVTSIRWTLLDLAGMKHPRAERALDQALAQALTSLGQIWRLYEEQWTRGRRGIAILRTFLAERTPGNAPDDSELERLLDGVIRGFGLPEPIRQHWIDLSARRIRVDYCYPDANLIIEADGYAFHSDRQAFEADRVRDNELQALGWRILRFTWAQLRFAPGEVAAMIRTHLDIFRRVVI